MSANAHRNIEGNDRRWINRREIASIKGALNPEAYVARAYLLAKESGSEPTWARKDAKGHWLFDETYIRSDANENAETIGITEAARLVGTSRRTVQTWVDDGLIDSEREIRHQGEVRKIPRGPFMAQLPELRRRVGLLSADGSCVPGPGGSPVGREKPRTPEEKQYLLKWDDRLKDVRSRRTMLERELRDVNRRRRTCENMVRRLQGKIHRLQEYMAKRLSVLEKQESHAARAAEAETRSVARLQGKIQAAIDREASIEESRQQALEAIRKKSAESLARQLLAARDQQAAAGSESAQAMGLERPVSDNLPDSKTREPVPPAVQHMDAVETDDGRAEQLARQFANAWHAGELDRVEAVVLFNDAAERLSVSADARVLLTRRFFSG